MSKRDNTFCTLKSRPHLRATFFKTFFIRNQLYRCNITQYKLMKKQITSISILDEIILPVKILATIQRIQKNIPQT